MEFIPIDNTIVFKQATGIFFWGGGGGGGGGMRGVMIKVPVYLGVCIYLFCKQ